MSTHGNHIDCGPGDVGRYVLLPGDPARAGLIARRFDAPRLVAANREFTTYTGSLLGETVSVTSTGIGCPSTAIAVEELAAIGAETLIRVGTCGGMQPGLALGDLVVATAAVRDEGTSRQYVPVEYPAVADLEVTRALLDGARQSGCAVQAGIVHSKDSFYGQQQAGRMPIAEELQARWSAWRRGGVLCSEMEAAALFVVAGVLGRRAGAVLMLAGNQERAPADLAEDEARGYSVESLIDAAIAGLRLLIRRDRDG
jgi:uridine phosphorylase